jgi:hypothetical protein
MASETPKGSVTSDTALPPQIIAQAEAAIAGNIPKERKPSYSEHQDTLQKVPSKGQTGLSKSVPFSAFALLMVTWLISYTGPQLEHVEHISTFRA